MLGNKSDLDTKRVVEMVDGKRLAESQGIAFMETSAKSNVNISEAFSTMAQIILEKVRRRGRDGRGSVLYSSATVGNLSLANWAKQT